MREWEGKMIIQDFLSPSLCLHASRPSASRKEGAKEGSPVSEAYGPSRGFTGTAKQHQLLASE